jgi:hypothetical protein
VATKAPKAHEVLRICFDGRLRTANLRHSLLRRDIHEALSCGDDGGSEPRPWSDPTRRTGPSGSDDGMSNARSFTDELPGAI